MSAAEQSLSSPSEPVATTAGGWSALRRGARRALAPTLLAGLLALAGAGAQALGGLPGVGALLAVVLPVLALWYVRREADADLSLADGDGDRTAEAGADMRLSAQVMPVWKRGIEAARAHSERSSESLLTAFGNVSGHLDRALAATDGGVQLDIGATDDLMSRHDGDLQNLIATARDAVTTKNQMQRQLGDVLAQMDNMLKLAREVQNIGRATHLLALNASSEAVRAGSVGDGFAVVAREVRVLAGQARTAGTDLGKALTTLRAGLDETQRRAARVDTDDDEIIRAAEQAARRMVSGVIDSVAEVSRSSRALQLAGREVQADLERIFMSLQSQDRLNQMLGSVTDDIARYVSWLHGTDDALSQSPQAWLERLEQSYTMEELRSAHHGTTVIEQAAGVEFF